MIRRFTKFTVRGIVGGIVDSLVLLLLSEFVFNTYVLEYIIAPAISFEVSLSVTYTMCYLWIWNHRVQNTLGDFVRRFPVYNLSAVVAFGVKLILLILFERLWHFRPVICNILALSVSGFFSFFLGDKVVFRLTRGKADDKTVYKVG
ncbi:MAG: GtrA family protein [Fidelibacterota bacterium]